jgi:dGTPase
MGHDVGHTPFAHAGEQILDELLRDGFRHNENSIRVLTRIEQNHGKRGLNLSAEVLDGVLNHSGYGTSENLASTLEGQVIRLSDKIAYVQHDIDDSIRAGLLNQGDIPEKYLKILGYSHSKRIATLVTNTITNTRWLIENSKTIKVEPGPEVEQALIGLREFMFETIYKGKVCMAERSRAMFIIEKLFEYYTRNPLKMSPFYQQVADEEGLERAVADYISGMSDAYCISLFNNIYIPRSLVPEASKIFANKE